MLYNRIQCICKATRTLIDRHSDAWNVGFSQGEATRNNVVASYRIIATVSKGVLEIRTDDKII